MPAKLTEEERDAARRQYLTDKSCTVDDLAALYSVSRATMLRVLSGITRPRGGRMKPIPTSQLVRMRDTEGMTYAAIGARVGLSTAGVQYRLREKGSK